MKLVQENSRQRIYLDDTGTYHEVRAETKGFFRLIEKTTYDSRDPADKARIAAIYKSLRLELAVWFADREDLDLIGEVQRTIGTGTPPAQVELGLVVPTMALIVEQPYWPPAPTEKED